MKRINENTEVHFNGALFLVRHLDITHYFIGSGKSESEALKDAEKTRAFLLQKRAERAVQP